MYNCSGIVGAHSSYNFLDNWQQSHNQRFWISVYRTSVLPYRQTDDTLWKMGTKVIVLSSWSHQGLWYFIIKIDKEIVLCKITKKLPKKLLVVIETLLTITTKVKLNILVNHLFYENLVNFTRLRLRRLLFSKLGYEKASVVTFLCDIWCSVVA